MPRQGCKSEDTLNSEFCYERFLQSIIFAEQALVVLLPQLLLQFLSLPPHCPLVDQTPFMLIALLFFVEAAQTPA
jgi:hypothetical protein